MANAAFDTLTVSKDLQQAGFEARQAEAIALAVKQSQGDLATKQDITLLKSDIDQLRIELKGDIKQLRSDIDQLRTELKGDIDQLRTELKGDIDQLRTELKSDIAQLTTTIDHVSTDLKSAISFGKWSLAILVALMLGGFTLIAT